LTTVGYTVAVVAFLVVVVVGTLALWMWALRRHDRQYPKGTRLEPGDREPRSIETKTTWLSGGRG
jgi:hypothetical protein